MLALAEEKYLVAIKQVRGGAHNCINYISSIFLQLSYKNNVLPSETQFIAEAYEQCIFFIKL